MCLRCAKPKVGIDYEATMRASIRKSKMTHKWLQSATVAVAKTCECVICWDAVERAQFLLMNRYFFTVRPRFTANDERRLCDISRAFAVSVRNESRSHALHMFVVIVPPWGCALSSECAPTNEKWLSWHTRNTHSNVILFAQHNLSPFIHTLGCRLSSPLAPHPLLMLLWKSFHVLPHPPPSSSSLSI